MIEHIIKDITTVETGIIAQGVNCQRTQGSGVALAIRKKWPKVYDLYMDLPRGKDMLGTAHCVNLSEGSNELYIFNCYTQVFYGFNGRFASPQAIQDTLEVVFDFAEFNEMDIYLPQIGAGRGGLNWEREVLPIIESIDTTMNFKNTAYICSWMEK